jgi:glycopeptide antibiotics resistance protein
MELTNGEKRKRNKMRQSKNFFTDKDSIRTIDTKRIVYLITAVLSFFGTEFGRFVYRPYIYENNINDFGLADSIGNWGGIVVQIFFGLALLNPPFNKGFRLIGLFVIGYIMYEILQPVLPKGTFDWLDVYGTLIGGAIGLLLYLIFHALIRQNNIILQIKK